MKKLLCVLQHAAPFLVLSTTHTQCYAHTLKVYADLNKSQILKGENKKGLTFYCCFMVQHTELEVHLKECVRYKKAAEHFYEASILDHTAWLAQSHSDRNENILNKTKTIL